MQDAGGLFSVVLKVNTLEEVEKFCNSLKHFFLAVSWGGHESLVIPAAVSIKQMSLMFLILPIDLYAFILALKIRII
jgi:cystathionine beta-lyase/cystathionine gamma-synthase